MFNNMGFIDFTQLNSRLVAEVRTQNSVYKVRYLNEDELYEVTGGKLAVPLLMKESPFLMGIGAPMFASGLRTSRVESITIKLANPDDFGTSPVWIKAIGGGPKGGAPAFAIAPEHEPVGVH